MPPRAYSEGPRRHGPPSRAAPSGGYKYAGGGEDVMDSEGMNATLDDVERLLTNTFQPSQQGPVREQLARLEDAPFIADDAARIKVAALLVAEGRWGDLVDAVELGLTDWRDLLVAAFYADHPRDGAGG